MSIQKSVEERQAASAAFNIERFRKVAEVARKAEAFIIEEAAKMGIELSTEQAAIFAECVRRAMENR